MVHTWSKHVMTGLFDVAAAAVAASGRYIEHFRLMYKLYAHHNVSVGSVTFLFYLFFLPSFRYIFSSLASFSLRKKTENVRDLEEN